MRIHPYKLIFSGVFIYVIIIGVFIQLYFLPNFPQFHYGHGLLKGGDWEHFHDTALLCSKLIVGFNYSECENLFQWQNVILIPSFAYHFSGVNEPWVILPLNALLFSISSTALVGIYGFFSNIRTAMIASLPFILYPSAAMIYGQIHKDVISICGVFLSIYIYMYLIVKKKNLNFLIVIKLFLLAIIANMLIVVVRPYLLQVLTFSFFAGLSIYILIKRKFSIYLFPIFFLILLQVLFIRLNTVDSGNNNGTKLINSELQNTQVQSSVLPNTQVPSGAIHVSEHSIIDRVVRKLGSTREAFANGYPSAKSNIDLDIKFESMYDVIAYLPRAMQIGLFAPFPNQWFSESKSEVGGVMRIISSLEMIVGYLLFIGLLLNFGMNAYANQINLIIAYFIPLTLIVIAALVVCNVGTMYRMRYGSWQLLNGFGLMGWVYWIEWKFNCGLFKS
jgi:hypothetical protein